mgnify:CR=1 FL=1
MKGTVHKGIVSLFDAELWFGDLVDTIFHRFAQGPGPQILPVGRQVSRIEVQSRGSEGLLVLWAE